MCPVPSINKSKNLCPLVNEDYLQIGIIFYDYSTKDVARIIFLPVKMMDYKVNVSLAM